MGRRMIVNNRCPICGEPVKEVPDSVLKQNPHQDNAEMVVTKRGLKQYIHSSCWYDMIKNKKPYNGRMFV
jgi:uncharacterized protein with PIN domain